MPPRIETVTILPTPAERQGLETKYFVINLQEESERFDIDLFHRQVKDACSILPKFQGQTSEKYVVIGDRMFVFSRLIPHDSFYSYITESGVVGELQSAGYIDINFALSRPGLKSGRKITGHSFSLMQAKLLSMEESNQYKRTTIKRVLGEFFQVL